MLRKLKEFKLPEVEEKVLKFWKENQIFEKSLKIREGGKPYNFFEGPPTANGRPGIHHILGRAFKDVLPRYKTMRGFYVARKAGWDTHGLPVEIEVEKELGFKGKQDIEKFGIAEFNEKAKASVWKYKDEWERLTDRVAFWLDMKDPYVTYSNPYIESLWWVLKQIANKKLLVRSFKIVPWCPRCQTPLSSHELAQPGAYKKVSDPSIYIKFKLKVKSLPAGGEYLLVWTTTPWTLPANVAVAVNPQLTYTKYKVGKEFVWSYNPPPEKAGVEVEVVEKISGQRLVGLKYEPLYSVATANPPAGGEKSFYSVKAADFISTEDGTGMVHIAPAFGEDDFNLIKKEVKDLALKAPITIDERGIMAKGFPGAGKFVKQADKDIILDITERNILYSLGTVEHEYPHCWRCASPLLYFAKFSWFIEMSKLRDKLLENNEKINWVPDHIKEGRFGEWLREIKDWAISRDRYWGTPLPIWKCEKCEHVEVVGGLEDFNKMRFSENNFWLLRHGEGTHNVSGIIASGIEGKNNTAHLTKKGKEQIEESAKKLVKQLGKKKLDLIISSPYARAKETAKIAAKLTGAKIITDKRLSELNVGAFNGRLVSDYHAAFKPFVLDRFVQAPVGGETLTDVKKRVMEFMIDINSKYSDKNILITGHGDPLWILETATENLSNEDALKAPYIQIGELRKIKFNNYPYNTITCELDLHKPYVDSVYLKCKKCKSKMSRVKEVADVWFDSGCMPYAQYHYPFDANLKKTEELELAKAKENIQFPADYISEGIDQTRGWFYTLLAISTALELGPSYLNVISLGLVLDKKGQKMSKSKGNVVDPWEMINKYGSDIVRWYFYTVNPPGEYKKFDELDLGKAYRRFIAIIFNSFIFLETYGVLGKKLSGNLSSLNLIDKWILARLNKMTIEVTAGLEKYDVTSSCKSIESFVDDLSRWFIRRSRRRFQKPESQEDLETASAVLGTCLLELSKLIAPFAPFFADALYRSLDENLKLSVHLENWPTINEEFTNNEIIEKMEEVRRIASLGLALRAEKKLKVRQPLAKLEINTKKLSIKDSEFMDLIKEEVNVKAVVINLQLKGEIELDTVITKELREEGLMRDLARMVQDLRQSGGCVPKDKVFLMIETDKDLELVIDANREGLKKDVGAGEIDLKKSDKFDAEIVSEMDGKKIWIGIRKI